MYSAANSHLLRKIHTPIFLYYLMPVISVLYKIFETAQQTTAEIAFHYKLV